MRWRSAQSDTGIGGSGGYRAARRDRCQAPSPKLPKGMSARCSRCSRIIRSGRRKVARGSAPTSAASKRCRALDPSHVGIAFGTRAGEHGAGGGGGFDQQALFLLERPAWRAAPSTISCSRLASASVVETRAGDGRHHPCCGGRGQGCPRSRRDPPPRRSDPSARTGSPQPPVANAARWSGPTRAAKAVLVSRLSSLVISPPDAGGPMRCAPRIRIGPGGTAAFLILSD